MFTATAPITITGTVGTAITTVDVSATDADAGDVLTYSWDITSANEAALGLALNSATGMITGTPLKAHNMAHTVTVSDGTATATLMVTITVSAADGTPPPVVTPPVVTPPVVTPPVTTTPGALAFSAASIVNQVFEAGKAIGTTTAPHFQLPNAMGGQSPYVYTLHRGAGQLDITATGHNGLTVDLADLRLSGSPTKADASGTMFTWRVTDANDDVVELSFTITVSPAGIVIETPVTVKAVATFSGALSLTGRSIITITFDKAVTGLTTADIAVTGGTVVAVNAKAVIAPTVANTVWEVAIDAAPFAQKITVTIASTSTVAKKSTTGGMLASAIPKGTLNSITAAAGANDTAKFVATLTFAAALPAGIHVVAADLTVTPTTAKIGAIASNLYRTEWEVRNHTDCRFSDNSRFICCG